MNVFKYTHFFVQVCRKGHELSNLATFELKNPQKSKYIGGFQAKKRKT